MPPTAKRAIKAAPAPAPADPPSPAAEPDTEKKPPGRPRESSLGGDIRRVNLSLDAGSLAIAARIRSNQSAAVREALRFWAEKHPA